MCGYGGRLGAHVPSTPLPWYGQNMSLRTYISAVADSEGVLRQIRQSHVHLTVLQLEDEESAVADAFMQFTRGSLPEHLRECMANKTIVLLHRRLCIAMISHQAMHDRSCGWHRGLASFLHSSPTLAHANHT